MKKTLKRMEETRKQDDLWLRDEMKKRITKALEMRKQKLVLIAQKKKEIEKLTEEILRLNGFVEEGSSLLNAKKEDPKKETK